MRHGGRRGWPELRFQSGLQAAVNMCESFAGVPQVRMADAGDEILARPQNLKRKIMTLGQAGEGLVGCQGHFVPAPPQFKGQSHHGEYVPSAAERGKEKMHNRLQGLFVPQSFAYAYGSRISRPYFGAVASSFSISAGPGGGGMAAPSGTACPTSKKNSSSPAGATRISIRTGWFDSFLK